MGDSKIIKGKKHKVVCEIQRYLFSQKDIHTQVIIHINDISNPKKEKRHIKKLMVDNPAITGHNMATARRGKSPTGRENKVFLGDVGATRLAGTAKAQADFQPYLASFLDFAKQEYPEKTLFSVPEKRISSFVVTLTTPPSTKSFVTTVNNITKRFPLSRCVPLGQYSYRWILEYPEDVTPPKKGMMFTFFGIFTVLTILLYVFLDNQNLLNF
jgi:hypothetical protein